LRKLIILPGFRTRVDRIFAGQQLNIVSGKTATVFQTIHVGLATNTPIDRQ